MCSVVRKLMLAGPMLLFVFSPYPLSWGQTNQKTYVAARVTQVVDETQLFRLHGNTHPLARPEFDIGGAPASLPMQRMLLVLRRSPEQESALRKLLDEQQDKSAPNYHKWLTPEDFGLQFGPADQDVQVVSSWLQAHGFQVTRVAKGRAVMEFSGTAGQVQEAFHTAIHKYVVKGQEHWANASDPQIPVALTPVVAGVHTLHNFYKKPQLIRVAETIKARYQPGPPPKVTFPAQPGQPALHALAPADYATIYNFNPLYNTGVNGAGTTIAVVARSDLYFGGADVFNFHGVFGVAGIGSLITINDGPDPGDLGGGEEAEATLDATWSSALAPGANIDFVVSASTDTTDGVDLSELYIVDNNLANVMTESFGECEQDLVSSGASLTSISALAEQAAAQGITYLVASGDSGAAGCDNPNAEAVASGGLAVSGLASTPFAVAVGGTMFNEHGSDSTYWNSTNNQSNFGSAKSYIPENVWNESCTAAQCGRNANIFAAGGGVSTFFTKPSWQTALTPNDGFRDLPDVSLTASGHDFYLLCLEGSCQPDVQGFISLFGVAGTSASTPSFAAIMALVNQEMTSSSNPTGRQGQADYVLYSLAANENLSQCNASSTTALPASNCIFNDITVGNNVVPGESGLSYSATKGYDLATGLGSVNVANLVTNWGKLTLTGTSTTLALNSSPGPISITHGQSVNVQIQVSPAGGSVVPAGDVALLAVTGATAQTVGFFPLSSGNASSTTKLLPGGTSYNVTAHYPGDASFLPSDSNPVSVTVNPEPSLTTLKAETLDQNFNFQPFTGGPYGSFVYLRADVTDAAGDLKHGIPGGGVDFWDGSSLLLISPLNSQGNASTPNFLNSQIGGTPTGLFTLTPGSHSMTATYGGDASFNSSNSSAVVLNITPATTATTVASAGAPQGATLTATVNTSSGGNAPSGNVTFFINGVQVGSPVPISGSQGPTTNPNTGALVGVQGIASFTDTALANGQYTLTATYAAGDTNYTGSSAAPITIKVQPDFVLSSSGSAIGVIAGGAGSLVLTIGANDGFTGTIQLSCSGLPVEGTCTFSPATIAGSGTTTLTVSTMAAHQTATLKHENNFRPWSGTVALMLAGFFLTGCPRKRQYRNKSHALLVFALLLTIMGCGGGGGSRAPRTDPGTPTGSYTVTVTASSGSLSHNVSFTLFVQ